MSTSAFNALLENEKLHDIWREMHPNKKQFTYLDKSRLDRFLISDECLNYTQNTHIFQAGIKTDHKWIKIDLNLERIQKGPGRWKLNTSILQDKVYKNNSKTQIQEVKKEYSFLCMQMLWEVCKIKIREYTIQYCKQKQAIKEML